MKRYYFTITSILALAIGITSCSNEGTKPQNQVAARPTVPLQNGEVRIGTQIWMTKNLNVSRYRNGDPIPQVTDPTQWANLTTGAWCYYDNDPANGPIYGKLYNWYAVNDPRGLAPIGWHVSSDTNGFEVSDWTTFMNFLGNSAGGKMKTTSLWNSPNIGATNSSGYTGLPGGFRNLGGFYEGIGNKGFWWSSTAYFRPDYPPTKAWARSLENATTIVTNWSAPRRWGLSVRCVKD